MWVKLMGNVAYNPISALTRATLIEIVQCPETRALAAAIMTEAEAVAQKLGIELGVSIEQRLDGAEKVGHHKTSMLQDVEAGRPMELEAIVGAVAELGDKMGLSLPCTKAVYACVKLLARKCKSNRIASHFRSYFISFVFDFSVSFVTCGSLLSRQMTNDHETTRTGRTMTDGRSQD